ncbi:MAG: aminoglycoside phosphotransferase family protein [Candidatus Eisenbacteria sp.]|nr:aminoglycoside phosphotransferase family protein [Candidatus Eisenbacteria bacterium]
MTGELKARTRALDPRRALKLLRETSGGSGWDIERLLSLDVIKERPGRRLTVRYDVAARRRGGPPDEYALYGKLYRGHRGARVHRLLIELSHRAPSGLRFPEPLGYEPRRRFLLIAGLAGRELSGLLGSPEAELHVRTFGDALASFHLLPVETIAAALPVDGGLPVHDPAAEIDVLSRARERIREQAPRPAVAEWFDGLSKQVSSGLGKPPEGVAGRAFRLLHRDLHPGQVLVDQRGMGLIDLDDAARGEPELDLGNVLAHFSLDDLQRHGRIGGARRLGQAFLEGYARRGSFHRDRLAFYLAGSCLRLASLERLAGGGISVLGYADLAQALMREAERALVAGGDG